MIKILPWWLFAETFDSSYCHGSTNVVFAWVHIFTHTVDYVANIILFYSYPVDFTLTTFMFLLSCNVCFEKCYINQFSTISIKYPQPCVMTTESLENLADVTQSMKLHFIDKDEKWSRQSYRYANECFRADLHPFVDTCWSGKEAHACGFISIMIEICKTQTGILIAS